MVEKLVRQRKSFGITSRADVPVLLSIYLSCSLTHGQLLAASVQRPGRLNQSRMFLVNLQDPLRLSGRVRSEYYLSSDPERLQLKVTNSRTS
jgi:hypothetical protein